jgi:hypothetical protein
VLQLLMQRALGWTELQVGTIDPENHRSRRMFERAGFVAIPATPGAAAAVSLCASRCADDREVHRRAHITLNLLVKHRAGPNRRPAGQARGRKPTGPRTMQRGVGGTGAAGRRRGSR